MSTRHFSKTSGEPAPLSWRYAGRVPYDDAIAEQEIARRRVIDGVAGAETLLLLEHDPVITLGKSAEPRHLLASPELLARRGIAVRTSTRGGEVTYHGPGQLMVYLVYRIRGSVEEYLATVAGALAEVAATLGVSGASWRRDPAGLWLGEAKLAACGLHISRRVAMHGFAFNVDSDPAAWSLIVPCGLPAPVISLAQARAQRGLLPPPPVSTIAPVVAAHVCRALGRQPCPARTRVH
ncbi:MAG TPA: lipoyl(octanoyl) transferase LipB [Kofleriaceae bacterium]|nr:lipoyl(octanoyl) transferase LipB [Kofleriaceae bacterium]